MTMVLSKGVLIAAAVAAGFALGIGFASAGAPTYLVLSILVGPTWLLGWWRRRIELVHAGLVIVVGAAAAGLAVDAPAPLMLVATCAALLAWDLMRLDLRLHSIKRVEHASEIERRHLRWAALSAAVGFVVGGLGLSIRAPFSFTAVFVIGLLAALAMGKAIRMLRS
jgi:hypothetical protein